MIGRYDQHMIKMWHHWKSIKDNIELSPSAIMPLNKTSRNLKKKKKFLKQLYSCREQVLLEADGRQSNARHTER